jgi:peptidoglycan/xylan/chitin deacetylase (PgdA/CDA1 family)
LNSSDPTAAQRVTALVRARKGPLRNRSGGATFLCYHSVADHGPPFFSIAPEAFERHLAWLQRRDHRSGSLESLRRIAEGLRPSASYVFISFDDGYSDNFTHALPLLQEYGFSATFFILPPYADLGAALDWPELGETPKQYPAVMRSMTWQMAESLVEAGCEVGSHTLRHRHLPEIDDEALRQELFDSRRRIADRLGRCDTLAYPFGEWDGRVARATAAAGYSFAFSLPYGAQPAASCMAIPRVTIDHRDRNGRFALKLTPIGRLLFFSSARGALRKLRPPTGAPLKR